MVLRTLRHSVAALSAFALLSSCSGGGSDTTHLSVGSNGAGRCDGIVVEIDLADAGAVLARLENGEVDCGAGRDVVASLCDIDFDEVSGGSRLRVTIGECRIDAIADLFHCAFERGDALAITRSLDISCDCVGESCDSSPPVCVDEDSDPGSCEDCSNGIDDDGNGDEDCDDDNCGNREPCSAPPTSSTSSSTTSSSTTMDTGDTTTTSTVTTTTLPGSGSGYDVVFRLEKAATFGSLQFDIHYGALEAASRRLRAVTGVECESLVTGALAEFNDEPSEQTVHAGLISLSGFTGPTDLARCNFQTDTEPEEEDFDVDVIEALDTNLEPIAGTVITVDEIVPVTTTTLPPVTTTSLPDTTTTTITLPVGPEYIVGFQLQSASTALGALQIRTNYTASKGQFSGEGAAVLCTNDVTGALFAPNHTSSTDTLTLGFIALTPFAAPTPLANCRFAGNLTAAPTIADFPVTIEDITDSDGNAATATITVTLQLAPD